MFAVSLLCAMCEIFSYHESSDVWRCESLCAWQGREKRKGLLKAVGMKIFWNVVDDVADNILCR